ncbi:hypothetical protein SK3146_03557 [Paenibacillus konkukensis]|uniref:DUF1835 domain-containing protein n=1 Tax=Paenibacillus konkukensis TaxID=2020716 RepID=A0ABY4RR98_9BACL|nr:DUF1835 domain-containing protein [Paenibacillus konkukensis]UQZ84311.1 hypothetical protein SK3146_03557 [Paenibacillus konkukensis]
MLHIVNGDGFGSILQASGMEGEILVWRESLYEGPISADLTNEAALEARLRYFAERGVPEALFRSYTDSQEEALRLIAQHDKVILWFEYDLFDQSMLIYLLMRLRQYREMWAGKTRLFLLCIDSFPGVHPFKGLGQLSSDQARSLAGTWQPITDEQLELGSRAWLAYASDDPRAVVELLHEDTSALPFVSRAMEHHLERFPSVSNGLNRVEQLTLEAVHGGATRIDSLFRQISEQTLDYGMGDLQYWGYLRSLNQGPSPMIRIDGPALPRYDQNGPIKFEAWCLTMTDFGVEVMASEKDAVLSNGIDRWLGGVHLQGKHRVWRWDTESQSLIRKKV